MLILDKGKYKNIITTISILILGVYNLDKILYDFKINNLFLYLVFIFVVGSIPASLIFDFIIPINNKIYGKSKKTKGKIQIISISIGLLLGAYFMGPYLLNYSNDLILNIVVLIIFLGFTGMIFSSFYMLSYILVPTLITYFVSDFFNIKNYLSNIKIFGFSLVLLYLFWMFNKEKIDRLFDDFFNNIEKNKI